MLKKIRLPSVIFILFLFIFLTSCGLYSETKLSDDIGNDFFVTGTDDSEKVPSASDISGTSVPSEEPSYIPDDTPSPSPAASPSPTSSPTFTAAPENASVPDRSNEEVYSDPRVWIPTRGGTKYHSNPHCSGMIDPAHVPLEEAVDQGFTPCKKCFG